MYVFYISDQVLDLHNCTIVCSLCILNLHPPVSCLPSPQLTLPEGTQPRWAHTLTAFKMDQGRVHATTFGGCSRYILEESDDDRPKLADTTVLEFGEQNTYHTTLNWVACSLTMSLMRIEQVPNRHTLGSNSLSNLCCPIVHIASNQTWT